MPNELSAAKSLAAKLEEFGDGLPDAEKDVLMSLMQIACARFSDAIGDLAPLSATDPDKELIDEAQTALESVAPDVSGVVPLTTPCWTATTVTTSLATSRYLCDER